MSQILDRYWPLRSDPNITFTSRIIETEHLLLVVAGAAWLVLTASLLLVDPSLHVNLDRIVQATRGMGLALGLSLLARFWRIISLSRNVHAWGWIVLMGLALLAIIYAIINISLGLESAP